MNKRKLKIWGYRVLTRIYGRFHKVQKKVLFSSFNCKQYSDNPRAVSEKMHELYPDFELVWLLKDYSNIDSVPKYVRIVYPTWYNIIKERATSFCIVNNEDYHEDVYKRKKQLIIQTWHGDRGFKKVLYDVPTNNNSSTYCVYDNEITDFCIAASEYGISQYRSAFRYSGEIIKEGMPRNDKLIQRNIEEERITRKKLGISDTSKVLIFAPTFRDNNSREQIANVDIKSVVECLEQKGEEWVCLIRAHSVSAGIKFDYDNKKYINVSKYPDMADLLAIGDLLISDYSSCAGDFILTGKGTILATFDKDEYESECRELLLDFRAAGFLTADCQKELIEIIQTYDDDAYAMNCKKLCEYFAIYESGHSSEIICNRIYETYNNYYNR